MSFMKIKFNCACKLCVTRMNSTPLKSTPLKSTKNACSSYISTFHSSIFRPVNQGVSERRQFLHNFNENMPLFHEKCLIRIVKIISCTSGWGDKRCEVMTSEWGSYPALGGELTGMNLRITMMLRYR